MPSSNQETTAARGLVTLSASVPFRPSISSRDHADFFASIDISISQRQVSRVITAVGRMREKWHLVSPQGPGWARRTAPTLRPSAPDDRGRLRLGIDGTSKRPNVARADYDRRTTFVGTDPEIPSAHVVYN